MIFWLVVVTTLILLDVGAKLLHLTTLTQAIVRTVPFPVTFAFLIWLLVHFVRAYWERS